MLVSTSHEPDLCYQAYPNRFNDLEKVICHVEPFLEVRANQLDRGRIDILAPLITCGDISVYRYKINKTVFEQISQPKGSIQFVFNRSFGERPIIVCNAIFEPLQLGIIHPGRDYACFNPNGLDTVSVSIPDVYLEDSALIENRTWRQTSTPERALFPLRSSRSAGFLEDLFGLFDNQGGVIYQPAGQEETIIFREWLIEELEAVIEEFCQLEKYQPNMKQKSRYNIFHAALEEVEKGLYDPLSTKELAQRVGISARFLQYAFKDMIGVSPVRYILYRKLNAARSELSAFNGHTRSPVSQVALRYGLHNFGRFSNEYHKLFGELPTDTLNQRN